MESWNYGSEGKGFLLSDELVPNTDALARNRTLVMGWDLKTPFNYDSTKLDSGRGEVDENQGFMELGFPDITRKPLPDNSFGGFLDCKMVSELESSPTCMSNSKEFSQEESSSRFSSTAGDSYSRDSSFIDLKLGSLADYPDSQTGKSSKEMSSVSSVVSFVPEKRARTMNLTYQNPVCQVHGCNMDLSNSKDYHKRHKVCDIHSKTAKVIVNGIEQRFCQQCSRFHLLAEFDDGKRSCRKRLAGHNERRRKPQLDNQTGRNGKLHLPYSGNRFLGTSLPMRASFINSDVFTDSIMQPLKYENSNWCRRVKLEEEFYNPPPMIPVMNEHYLPKASLPLFGVEKQYPFLHGNGVGTTARSNFCDNSNRYLHNLPDPDSGTGFVLRTVPSNREEISVYDSTSTIQGVSGASDSSSALSLLSSQSMNSSSHSSGIPIGQPLLVQGNHAHYNLDQFSDKPFGVNSHASDTLVSNRFSSSSEFDRLVPIADSGGSNSDFNVHTNGIFQGSEFMTARDPLSHEHTTTIDLLQLSSQLHQVENQRNSMQVKQEADNFGCPL